MTTLIESAETAQRHSDWPTAAALWRQAAEACDDPPQRQRYLQQAAWCDDMAMLIAESDVRT